jgi:phosphotransferase system enzyme I (PtsP)
MADKLLELLRNISEVIAHADDSAKALSRVAKILAHGLEVEVCSVYEHDINNDNLVLLATHGLNQDAIGKVKMHSGEGLTGKCFKHNVVINLANPSQDPAYKYFKNTGEERFKSFMAVPLILAGSCVGVFTLQRTVAEKFPRQIVDVGRSLAPQLANLIINAEIFKTLAQEPAQVMPKAKQGEISFFMQGSAANVGIGKGQIFKYLANNVLDEMEHSTHSNTEKELNFFDRALLLARENTLELEYKALSLISEADASIFNSHLLILEDKTVIDEVRREIINEHHTLEFSLAVVYRRFKKKFIALDNQVLRERLVDFKDAMMRLLESTGFIREQRKAEFSFTGTEGRWIIVAAELLPSDLIRMPLDNIAGIVCEKGGITSHVAILAKAFSIPALMGVKGIIDRVENYDNAIIDGYAEKIHINPDNELKSEYKRMIREELFRDTKIIENVSSEIFTADGHEIDCKANISLISETSLLTKYGAKGIGLYRTEFLFMIRDYLPSEETQFDIFTKVIKASNGDVTLRLLDAGGDKQVVPVPIPQEENPALGLRGIRLLNAYPNLLRTHLRAILRAGQFGKIKIMLPMISTLAEIREFKKLLKTVEQELAEEQLNYATNYELGIMIEIPSVVFDLPKIIEEIDFASIGTNDLFQFAFACDRASEASQHTVDYFDPAFLRILIAIGDIFAKYPEKELAICGEMVSNSLATPLLLGAGIYSFSMPAKLIADIKKIIPAFSLHECQALLRQAVASPDSSCVTAIIKEAFATKNI